jgi:ABC-type transporter Mla subunit MlaD
LAFINQWLLHLAGVRVEAVRDSARTWFDSAIWRKVGLDVQAATVEAIGAMERMAKSVAQSAVRQEENAAALRKSIAKIYKSSDTFQQTYVAFGEELGELPQSLAEVTLTARAAVEAIQSLIPVGERAVRGLDVSVSAFSDAVETQFAEAAKNHRTTTESLEAAVGRINESTMQLKVSSGDLQETVNVHTNSFKNLNRSLQKQVLPAHESFLAAMSRFNGQADGLLERLDSLHSEVIASIEKMTSLAPEATDAIAKFTASAGAFSSAVEDEFAVAAQEHRENTDKLVDSVSRLRQSTDGLTEGGAAVEGLVTLHAQLGQQLEGMQQSLRQAVDQLAETGASLHQSFENEVVPSQRSMNEAVNSFADSSQHLAAFINQGIVPATERFADMDETMKRLVGTVEAIQNFSEVRKDIEHLSQALAQAAQVADAITALPEQIRNVLEEVARAHEEQALANSRGSLTWFRGRKRAAGTS